ncbi:MAG: xanthine dehydrogenase small subunit [Rudaea sp.]|uniref:xanthine dehydrogenase small subunit n=1 Tax=unclassified Rudaea TaxID=2627037 RepID=UPI0010F57DA3|nr:MULTISPECIES: xanthine dehydrogenase small subunit [unclassified Rudaea]MBN8886003.1 xanthine dehydrogenase small subunit [Rudaea sp.]MBR0347799.1 xanthine dehydrogenase small subunit [Rudaea sp.]
MSARAGEVIRFVLDGEVVEVAGLAPTTTVLEWLREHRHRSGTKEGCAEGDCGACTVVLGELDAGSGGEGAAEHVRYRAINSCIRFLPTIDGKELVTVESLADGDKLHPVQQAMVDHHASQCGFCTPGFVMSLFALYQQNEAANREEVIEALAGNLCRCTGYRPIIDAGCAMHTYDAPQCWSRAAAQSKQHVETLRSLGREVPLALPGFSAPRTLDELATLREKNPDALLLAGGTDVGLWVTKHLRELPPLIYLGEVAELRQIEDRGGALRIGAAVSLADAWAAIVARVPTLAELAQRFASPPVRNSGTLVGNIANGSPIGDAMPALIALGATIELRRGVVARTLPLEALYVDYMKKDLARGEFVVAVSVPVPNAATRVASYKLSKRIDQDISAVCSAFAVEVADGRIVAARIAYGGMAAIPARAKHAEAALVGRLFAEAIFAEAAAALAADFKPLSDMRASAGYRLQGAQNLLRRFYLAHAAPQALRTHLVEVSV